MKSTGALVWLAVLFLFSGGMVLWFVSQKWQRTGRDAQQVDSASSSASTQASAAPIPVLEFELTDQSGRAFRSEQMRGKVWIASFFFSRCPQTCRMQNQQVARLQQAFGRDGVHFVSITCDPGHDTPAVLTRYAALFNAEEDKWHFLCGDFGMVKRIGAGMQITVEEQMHSDRLLVIDRAGTIRGSFRATVPEQVTALEELVRRLLQELESSQRDDAEAGDGKSTAEQES